MKLLLIPGLPLVLLSAAIDKDKASAPSAVLAALHGIGIAGPVLLVILFLFIVMRTKRC